MNAPDAPEAPATGRAFRVSTRGRKRVHDQRKDLALQFRAIVLVEDGPRLIA